VQFPLPTGNIRQTKFIDTWRDSLRNVMTITLNLPEDIAQRFAARGEDPARTALEASALEGYRSRTLSEEQKGVEFDQGECRPII
jgi:hypothetical protein